jgi:hypothetical protein
MCATNESAQSSTPDRVTLGGVVPSVGNVTESEACMRGPPIHDVFALGVAGKTPKSATPVNVSTANAMSRQSPNAVCFCPAGHDARTVAKWNVRVDSMMTRCAPRAGVSTRDGRCRVLVVISTARLSVFVSADVGRWWRSVGAAVANVASGGETEKETLTPPLDVRTEAPSIES